MVTKEKQPALKLSLSQLWICITVIAGLLGTMFGAGIKVQSEVMKVNLLKQEQLFQNQLSEISIKLRTSNEDAVYFKDRFAVTKDRLTSCLNKCNEAKENTIE